LLFRVKNPIGESSNLPFFTGVFFTELLKTQEKTVVIFHDGPSNLDFANFVIDQYRNKISFLRSGASDGEKCGCQYYPCVVAFEKGKQMEIPHGPTRAASLLSWMKGVVSPTVNTITVPEQLRKVLKGPCVAYFGVDLDSRPKNITKDQDFYLVPSSVFSYFNISLTKGLYVYTSVDRQIVPYTSPVTTTLTDPMEVDITKRPYFAGYVIDPSLTSVSERQIEILKVLSNKFSKDFGFAPIHGDNAALFLKAGKMEALSAPYFVVFNASDITGGRWLLYREDDHFMDQQSVETFLGQILSGELPHSIISEEEPKDADRSFQKVVGSTFHDRIYKNTNHSVLVFTAPWCQHCPRFKIIIEEISKEFIGLPINFYWMDGSANDTPDTVPQYDGYPTMMFWRSQQKQEVPLVYSSTRRVVDIMDFIVKGINNTFTLPNYNITQIDEVVNHKMEQLKKTE